MPLCLPTPNVKWAQDSTSFTYWGPRWVLASYWTNRFAAMRALAATHATTVAGVAAQVNAASPGGCTPRTTQAGPFESIAHTGWWSGSGTLTLRTEVTGRYFCDRVPPGEIEYK